jgi:hypothetical protein
MKPRPHFLLALVILLGLHLALPAQKDWESGGFFFDLIRPADLQGYHQLELYDSASKGWARRRRWHSYRCFTLDAAGRPVSDVHWSYFNAKDLEFADTILYHYAADGTYQRFRPGKQPPAPDQFPGEWAKFDEQGRIKELRGLSTRGKLYLEESYTWSSDGLRFTIATSMPFLRQHEGEITSVHVSDYDATGKLITRLDSISYSAQRSTFSYQDSLVTVMKASLTFPNDPSTKLLVYLDPSGLPTRAEAYHQGRKEKWVLSSHLTFRYVR